MNKYENLLGQVEKLRDAGNYGDARGLIAHIREDAAGTSVETNALHALLRMEIFLENWAGAVRTADEMIERCRFAGSITTLEEVFYLKAFALEQSGDLREASSLYSSLPDNLNSFYGALATAKLAQFEQKYEIPDADILWRDRKTATLTPRMIEGFPLKYRAELLKTAQNVTIDPRFLLALIKMESDFRPDAKSQFDIRGLMQLGAPVAETFKIDADYPQLQPDDLFQPEINIAIGGIYVGELKKNFVFYEAVAACFHAGAQKTNYWLKKSKSGDPGVFVAEIDLKTAKDYVFQVMKYHRIYRRICTNELNSKN